ncbi:MAG: hypothetical protein LBM98_10660 [Oscillospiraceae bacterium]|nr:hypothetical protein [Oscillospiraceae bacterium]
MAFYAFEKFFQLSCLKRLQFGIDLCIIGIADVITVSATARVVPSTHADMQDKKGVPQSSLVSAPLPIITRFPCVFQGGFRLGGGCGIMRRGGFLPAPLLLFARCESFPRGERVFQENRPRRDKRTGRGEQYFIEEEHKMFTRHSKRILALAIAAILTISLGACGVKQDLYDGTVNKNKELQRELDTLQNQLSTVTAQKDKIVEDKNRLQTEYDTLKINSADWLLLSEDDKAAAKAKAEVARAEAEAEAARAAAEAEAARVAAEAEAARVAAEVEAKRLEEQEAARIAAEEKAKADKIAADKRAEEAAKTVTTTVKEICDDFWNNQAKADLKYRGKTIVVTGKVGRIDTEMFGSGYYLVLRSGELLANSVFCYGISSEVLSTLDEGETITVRGDFGSGGDLGVDIKNCTVQ